MSSGVIFGPEYADRIGRVVRSVEAQAPSGRINRGNHRTPLFNAELGWIIEHGPDEEDDFGNHQYWVRRIRASNDDPAANDPMKLAEYPDDWFTHDIVPVTNFGEQWTRGHLLRLNQPIVFYAAYDRNDPAEIRFWTITPPPQPWMWVRITGSDSLVPNANQWIYSGVRQIISAAGRFDLGVDFYARTLERNILNPSEAYNTGADIEGNSIDVTRLAGTCEMVPIRGDPVVAVAPTYYDYDEDGENGNVIWMVIGYPNAIDLVRQ